MKRAFTVLIADDHPIFREGVAALLSRDDRFIVCGQVENGEQAIAALAQNRPDIVLMDISMPGVGGLEAANKILARVPTTKVIILSASADKRDIDQAQAIGVSGYLLKRSAVVNLLPALTIVSEGRRYVDPALSALTSDKRTNEAPPHSEGLTPREAEVMRLFALGFTGKEVASSLGLSPKTIETFKMRACEKLGLKSRAEIVRYAARCGWLTEI